ncbi:MAG: hypothetical protein JEZ02_18455 [Desulfatibacillum sp.]|nr:hypothetical protein [Desulfatibacillum sp.]
MKPIFTRAMVLAASLVLAAGCASTPKSIPAERIQGYKTIAVVVAQEDSGLHLIDHTRVSEQTQPVIDLLVGIRIY